VHLHDVGAAVRVEHVVALEESRERLAVLAVAQRVVARVRCDAGHDAVHFAAPATQRKVRHARQASMLHSPVVVPLSSLLAPSSELLLSSELPLDSLEVLPSLLEPVSPVLPVLSPSSDELSPIV
jgi:hypothetical protein